MQSRAVGALLLTAVGDALGVPYEFGRRLGATNIPEMIGGGLGDYAPGEWSDDTSMAVAIAEVAATGADLASAEGLDGVARGFLRWVSDFPGNRPPDIGNQTYAVLDAARRRLAQDPDVAPGEVLLEISTAYADAHPRSAGNGALMRTAPVALAHLDDRDHLAEAARAVAALTHADELAGDSCVLWCEAIRIAILQARFDVRSGLDLLPADRRDQWGDWLGAAEIGDPLDFSPNGFTVAALQAAIAAILQTPIADDQPGRHHLEALYTAVRIGDDTDTVAAIAGGLLGARWGADVVSAEHREAVHGWPYVGNSPTTAAELQKYATAACG
ncbi:ADP-ribosylglycohydrolase family protein [Gordonia desulfuricans]|uniref:ADP-ribosylglycohydrolase family protein n=1 Tax=Gordonia desulfuricans TaxID=89051 RepID=A0A7K3LNF8_9ACTN|nr:ADP-ribosylglycohydrolase family protein [Gordonia desulfuricans]